MNIYIILKSEIKGYINLENIDLKKLFYKANNTSLVKESCTLWNQGMSLGEISKCIKFGKATVRKYLKIGANIGLCKYDGSTSYERGKEQFSNGIYEYSLHFRSALEFTNFLELYNIPLNFNTIQNRFRKEKSDETIINDIRIERTRIKKGDK